MTRASAPRIFLLLPLLLLVIGPGIAHGQTEAGLRGEAEPGLATETYVTVRVETTDGEWVRLTLREGRTGTVKLLATGERYGITPRTLPGVDEARLEVVRLDAVPIVPGHAPEPQTLTARVGFPSFPAAAGLFRIELESVETRRAEAGEPARLAPRSGAPSTADLDFTDQCCVTCNGIESCGCAVGASCGSCCDCCSPRAK